jgi:hypothetical protein
LVDNHYIIELNVDGSEIKDVTAKKVFSSGPVITYQPKVSKLEEKLDGDGEVLLD